MPIKEEIISRNHIRVRPMILEELDEVLELARRNHVFVPKERALNLHLKGILKVLTAVLPTGDIVGTLWITSYPGTNWGLIGGITFLRRNYLIAKDELFSAARVCLLGKKIYINAPNSYCLYFDKHSYVNGGDFYLYNCNSSETLIPLYEVEYYSIQTVEEKYEAEICYRARKENEVLGMGALTYSDEGRWLIGPLLAENVEVAKFLLKHLLLYARKNELNGIISIYVKRQLGNNGCQFIEEFGFKKHAIEFTRYCSVEPRSEACFNTNRKLYALESIALQLF